MVSSAQRGVVSCAQSRCFPGLQARWRAFLAASRALLLVLLGLAKSAAADSSGWLEVERGDSARACPGAVQLRKSVEQLLDSPPSSEAPLIRVTFLIEGQLLSARLSRLGDEAAAREIIDTHPDCDTLAQAVSTTVALMLETRVTLPEPVPERPEPQVELRPRAEPQGDLPHNALGVEVSGGAAFEVIDGISPMVAAAGVFEHDFMRVSLGVTWILPKRVELGPGYVDASVLTLTSRACLRLVDLAQLDIWGCTGVFAGLFKASAHGYTRDLHGSEPWFAVPLEASFSGLLHQTQSLAFHWRLGGTVLGPIPRQSFSVEGLGKVVEPGKVQGLLWLGLEGFSRW